MGIAQRKGSYGIDAPYAPALMIAGAVCCIGLVVFAHLVQFRLTAVILLTLAIIYLHTSLRGKFLVWRELLDGLALRGDERLLDLGCGRGALLLLAARRLPRGSAVGIDIWSSKDQSGNTMDATRANASAEGIAERIELRTADMRQLPFDNDSFDLIISNVAVHNISSSAGRDAAINEAWRVLRPGGRMLIADISRSGRYLQILLELGASVTRRNLGWRMWWGGPWAPTVLIDAHKPPST